MNNYQKFQHYLKQNIFINISPVDDWDDWKYQILMKDCMAPFFVAHNDYGFESYDSALDHAINYIEQNLN